MNINRHVRAIFFSLIGMFLLVQYQNCAPAGPIIESQQLDSTPGTIDDSKTSTAVFFPAKKIELANTDVFFEADGVCSQEQSGAILAWYLVDDASNAIIQSGRANCQLGGFTVTVEGSQSLDCGEPYMLHAQLGAGAEGDVQVVRRCQSAQ